MHKTNYALTIKKRDTNDKHETNTARLAGVLAILSSPTAL